MYSKKKAPRPAPTLTRILTSQKIEDELNAGFPEQELKAVMRSGFYDVGNAMYTGYLWLGIKKESSGFVYQLIEVVGNTHTLILEEKSLDKVVTAANQHLMQKEILDPECGASSFSKKEFESNLSQILENPDLFYKKRDDVIKAENAPNNKKNSFVEINLHIANGRLPSTSFQSLEEFRDLSKKGEDYWQKKINHLASLDKETFIQSNARKLYQQINYFAFQSPFFPQTLTEKEQKKLREALYEYKTQVTLKHYQEEISIMKEFYCSIFDEFYSGGKEANFKEFERRVFKSVRFSYEHNVLENASQPSRWRHLTPPAKPLPFLEHSFASMVVREIKRYGPVYQNKILKKCLNKVAPGGYAKIQKKIRSKIKYDNGATLKLDSSVKSWEVVDYALFEGIVADYLHEEIEDFKKDPSLKDKLFSKERKEGKERRKAKAALLVGSEASPK